MEAITIQKVRKGFAIDEDYKFDDCSKKGEYFEMVDKKKWWKKASKNEIVFVIDKYIIRWCRFFGKEDYWEYC